MILRAMFSRRWIVATMLVLLGGAMCIRLGIWQLDRLNQRRIFNAHYLSVITLPQMDLNSDINTDLTKMEYRAITVQGEYDFTNQVALLNFYFEGVYGYHLLTPLRLSDGRAVLVERGWIPAEGNGTRVGWSRYDEVGERLIKGVIRLGVTKVPLGGRADPTPATGQTGLDFWNFINLERLASQIPFPILPIYIQPAGDANDLIPPISTPIEVEITEGPHLGYALQWFTFAIILLIGYPFYVNRQEKVSP